MNKALFYKQFRIEFGILDQVQVDVIEHILDCGWDNAQRAYIIATSWHESRLRPVREGFKNTDAEARAFVKRQGYKYAKVVNGHVYYGRGLIQLTHDYNYKSKGEALGIDLYNNPDLALEVDVAKLLLIEWFRTEVKNKKTFFQVVNDNKHDFLWARRFVNGTDKAELIKGYADKILRIIENANRIDSN